MLGGGKEIKEKGEGGGNYQRQGLVMIGVLIPVRCGRIQCAGRKSHRDRMGNSRNEQERGRKIGREQEGDRKTRGRKGNRKIGREDRRMEERGEKIGKEEERKEDRGVGG